jgi:hypothetical protein
MTDVSHRQRGDIAEHPDAMEMRERYSRVMGGRHVTLVDAPLFLAGLYAAVSPWTLHFTDNQSALTVNNLIVGIAVAILALGLSRAPERMSGMSLAISALGAWLVISPWLSGDDPDAGVVLNNVIVGGIIFLLGLACAATAMKAAKGPRGAAHNR